MSPHYIITEKDMYEIESLFMQKKGILELIDTTEPEDPIYDMLQDDLALITKHYDLWFERLEHALATQDDSGKEKIQFPQFFK